jgi:poly-beta-1,6-N-acetyl-D-glucosamine biosynthesis protein PgaD
MLEKAGYRQLLELFGKMGWTILVVFLVLRLWGYYNYVKFGKKDRRKSAPSTTAEQLSEFFHVPPEQIPELQSRKEIVARVWQEASQDGLIPCIFEPDEDLKAYRKNLGARIF